MVCKEYRAYPSLDEKHAIDFVLSQNWLQEKRGLTKKKKNKKILRKVKDSGRQTL